MHRCPERIRRTVPTSLLREGGGRERLNELYTAPGRRLGDSRRQFMDDFFAQFESEIGVEGEQ